MKITKKLQSKKVWKPKPPIQKDQIAYNSRSTKKSGEPSVPKVIKPVKNLFKKAVNYHTFHPIKQFNDDMKTWPMKFTT